MFGNNVRVTPTIVDYSVLTKQYSMIVNKKLVKEDLEKIGDIDRSEPIDESYILENGELKISENKKEVPNWDE